MHLLAIADSSSNQYLGRCGFLDTGKKDEKELYVLLGSQSQKKGYGQIIIPFLSSLAMAEGYKSVAYLDPGNMGSLKLLEKLRWAKSGIVEKNNYQYGHLIYLPPEHGI